MESALKAPPKKIQVIESAPLPASYISSLTMPDINGQQGEMWGQDSCVAVKVVSVNPFHAVVWFSLELRDTFDRPVLMTLKDCKERITLTIQCENSHMLVEALDSMSQKFEMVGEKEGSELRLQVSLKCLVDEQDTKAHWATDALYRVPILFAFKLNGQDAEPAMVKVQFLDSSASWWFSCRKTLPESVAIPHRFTFKAPFSDFDGKYTEVILDMDNDVETRNAVHAGVTFCKSSMQNSKYHHRRGVYLCMLDSRCGYRA